MDGFEILTENYIKELKKTAIYKQYREKLTNLKKDEEMWKKVSEYKQRRFEFEKNTSGDELFDKADGFERDNAFIFENKAAREYLEAEVALCKMVREIYYTITQSIEFE